MEKYLKINLQLFAEKEDEEIDDEIIESFKFDKVNDMEYTITPIKIGLYNQYQHINTYFFGTLLILFGARYNKQLCNCFWAYNIGKTKFI